MRAIGIDLGTTNSCVAIHEPAGPEVIPSVADGSRTMPSVVAFTEEGKELVGAPAKRQAILNPEGTVASVKRLMGRRADERPQSLGALSVPVIDQDGWLNLQVGGKKLLPQEVSARILAQLKKHAEAHLGEEVTEAVITVPAYFNDSQRKATIEAGEIAGLNVLRIINEPTAAALAFGVEKKEGMVLVFDLGGGTFDVSILDIEDGVFEVKATAGDNSLGGDDFDEVLVHYLLEKIHKEHGVDLASDSTAMQRLFEQAEQAKRDLSGVETATINLPYITMVNTGPNKGPVHFKLDITRDQLEDMVAPLVLRLQEPVEKVLEDSGLRPEDIDDVILVGGMTRMPIVIELVRRLTGQDPVRSINPDEAVAMGAAIQARVLSAGPDEDFAGSDVLLMDVTPLTLGIETRGGVSVPLIERNSTIPITESRVFTTAEDNQTSVEIHILQGERARANDNRTLARLSLHDIPPLKRGRPQIEVTFSIDPDGILKVTAMDLESGNEQAVRVEGSSALSEEERDKRISEAEEKSLHDRQLRERVALRNRADALAYATESALKRHHTKLPADVRDMLSEAIVRVRDALRQDDEHLGELAEDLMEVSGMLTEVLYGQQAEMPDEVQSLLDKNVPTVEELGLAGSASSSLDTPARAFDSDDDEDVDFEDYLVLQDDDDE